MVEKNHQYFYGRFNGLCTENEVAVFLDPEEKSTETIGIKSIFPLRKQTLQAIQLASIEDLEKYVQLPTDVIFQELMASVETITYEYFKSISVDMNVIYKANINICSISELNKLKVASEKLQELTINPPFNLFVNLQNLLKHKLEEFQMNMETNQIQLFKPTLQKSLYQLQNFQMNQLVMMHIHRYVGICQSGLDQLKLQKRELMNGHRKEKITEWWLHEIDVSVLNFLDSLYSFYI